MKKLFAGLSIILLMCIACGCIAAEDLSIAREISYDPGARLLSLLISDNRSSGPEPETAEVSFDEISLENTAYQPLPASGLPIVFCFVVDTTPTAFSYQTKIPGELAGAFAGYRGNKTDKYYLISYDTEVHEAAGPVQNPGTIFDEINYAGGYNIVGDYSEALMKAVDLLNAHEGFCKKVIILITDGNQVKKPFLQDTGDNGLLEKLETAGYPVYAFGMMQSETEDYVESSLKKLQNISTAAGGMYVSYKDNPEPGKDFYDRIIRSGVVSGTIPAAYEKTASDPVEVTVRLLRSNGAEIRSLISGLILPAIEGQVLPTEEPVILPTEAVSVSTQEQIQTMLRDKLGDNWAYILGAGLALIILIILILSISGRSRKSKKKEQETKAAKQEQETGSGELTAVLETKPEQKDTSKAYLAYLTDQSNGVTCSASLRDGQAVIYGRLNDKAGGVIGLGGDPHISRKQFTLTNDNEKIILEDLASENGTFLNGERISGKVSVKSGDLIRIGGIPGEREFRVSLMEL